MGCQAPCPQVRPCQKGGRDTAGGHLVIETPLDAFAFFLRCDPTLARRGPGTDDVAYFPLPAYTVHDDERRHPDQPNRAAFGAAVRRLAEDAPPSGTAREISYRLTSNDTAVYCGHTVVLSGLRSASPRPALRSPPMPKVGFPQTVSRWYREQRQER